MTEENLLTPGPQASDDERSQTRTLVRDDEDDTDKATPDPSSGAKGGLAADTRGTSRATDFSVMKDSGYSGASDVGGFSRNQTPDYTSEESSGQHRPLLKKRADDQRALSAIEDEQEYEQFLAGRERPQLISSEFNGDQ